MQEQLLIRFSGKLSDEKIADGMNAAIQNAARLASDARLLLDAGRFPTAASIAALSIEESGKVSILRRLVTAHDEKDLKQIWTEYRSHKAKNTMWILPKLAAGGANQLAHFADAVDKESEHSALLDALKQIGFYTDCYGDSHWSVPPNVISADLAKHLVFTAEVLSTKKSVSVREIELWKKFMAPVWETSAMRNAVIRWHQAMVDEGLASHSQEEFERFILGPEAGPVLGDKPKS